MGDETNLTAAQAFLKNPYTMAGTQFAVVRWGPCPNPPLFFKGLYQKRLRAPSGLVAPRDQNSSERYCDYVDGLATN